MEQGLSFLGVITLCTISLLWLNSQPLFLGTFIIGGIYLVLRGKRKGWSWRR
jgi:hypothetical protein